MVCYCDTEVFLSHDMRHDEMTRGILGSRHMKAWQSSIIFSLQFLVLIKKIEAVVEDLKLGLVRKSDSLDA
jgi:hypothetical protein